MKLISNENYLNFLIKLVNMAVWLTNNKILLNLVAGYVFQQNSIIPIITRRNLFENVVDQSKNGNV